MKNKVVKQLLMVCMAMTLSVSMPMTSLAAETKEEKNESEEVTDDIIEITKDKANTVFYKDDKLSVSYEKGEYTTGASDLVLTLDIENKYPNIVTLNFKDAKLDDSAIAFEWDTNDYQAGIECGSCWYIMLEKIQSIGHTEFEKLSFTMLGTLNDGTELFEKNVSIDRDVLKSLEDTDSNSSNTQEVDKNTLEESQSDDKYDELSKKIEALEAKNKELEDKNKELEDKLNKAEEEKNQEETPTPEQTKAPAEDTPAPEPTVEPTEEPVQEEAAPETEQKPVVEYKDATTIRIVQQALNDAGYNCGNPDGVAGGKTTEAVTKYQTDKGLTINGLVTDELLQSLNVVEKVQDAVQKEESSGAAKVDDIFRRLEDLGKNTLLQVTDPFEEDGVKGYVINFKNTLYTSLVNPDNEGKISIFIAPQEKYMDNIDSSEFIDMMAYMAQAFDSTLSSKEAYSVIADTINNESCNKNGYEYTFYKSLLGMTMTN